MLEQPQRQQRLHDEAAGKGVEAEQRRKLVDHAARRAERRADVTLLGAALPQAAIERGGQEPERAVAAEHQLESRDLADAGTDHEVGPGGASAPAALDMAPIRL